MHYFAKLIFCAIEGTKNCKITTFFLYITYLKEFTVMNKKIKIIIVISVIAVVIAVASVLLINNLNNVKYFSDYSLNTDYNYATITDNDNISYSVYTLNSNDAVNEILNDKSFIKITDDNFDEISSLIIQLKTIVQEDESLYNKISESFCFDETLKKDDYFKLKGSIDKGKFTFTYYNSYSEALIILEKK